jgi:antitoxin HicB
MRYPVTLSKDDNGTFLVRFADVPEAITYGDTKEEALAHAQDALLTAFDAYIKDRRDIPEPSGRGGASVEVPALEASKIALYRAMRERSINKSELARRLHWHLPQVDRVLDVRHGSQIDQIESALAAVGKRLVVNVIDAEPKRMARFGAPGLRKTRGPRPMAARYKRAAKKR